MRKWDFNIFFIESQFEPPVEFSPDTPLLARFGRRSGFDHNRRIIKFIQSEDFNGFQNIFFESRIIPYFFVHLFDHIYHFVYIFPVGDSDLKHIPGIFFCHVRHHIDISVGDVVDFASEIP